MKKTIALLFAVAALAGCNRNSDMSNNGTTSTSGANTNSASGAVNEPAGGSTNLPATTNSSKQP